MNHCLDAERSRLSEMQKRLRRIFQEELELGISTTPAWYGELRKEVEDAYEAQHKLVTALEQLEQRTHETWKLSQDLDGARHIIETLKSDLEQAREIIKYAKLVCKEGGWLSPLQQSIDRYEALNQQGDK